MVKNSPLPIHEVQLTSLTSLSSYATMLEVYLKTELNAEVRQFLRHDNSLTVHAFRLAYNSTHNSLQTYVYDVTLPRCNTYQQPIPPTCRPAVFTTHTYVTVTPSIDSLPQRTQIIFENAVSFVTSDSGRNKRIIVRARQITVSRKRSYSRWPPFPAGAARPVAADTSLPENASCHCMTPWALTNIIRVNYIISKIIRILRLQA